MYKVHLRFVYGGSAFTYFYEEPTQHDIDTFWKVYAWHSGTALVSWIGWLVEDTD
jgi:hypothetical protein